MIRSRRVPVIVLLASLAASAAFAESNTIREVKATAEGASTVIVVHGDATPSFTVYRLEQPARLVVDFAGGRLGADEGPIDVDTFAVGQIAFAQYAGTTMRTARVLIGLKRAVSYDVKARGNDLIVRITPDELPPAPSLANARAAEEAQRARIAEEQRARQAATVRASEEHRAQQATAARNVEEERLRQTEAARQRAEAEASAARVSRDRAQAELARLAEERARAERALAEATRSDRSAGVEREIAAKQGELARLRAAQASAAERARGEEAQLAARMAAARAETENLARARAAEEQRTQQAQTARSAEEERLRQAEAARQRADAEANLARIARDRAQAELARVAEERSAAEKALAAARASHGQSARIEQEIAAREATLVRLRSEQAQAAERARTQEGELSARLAALRSENDHLARGRGVEEARRKQAEEARAREEQRAREATAARTIEEERRKQAEEARQRAEAEALSARAARDEARSELSRLAEEKKRAQEALQAARAANRTNAGLAAEVASREAALVGVRAEQARASERIRQQEAELERRLAAVRSESDNLARARAADEQRRKDAETARAADEQRRKDAETARAADEQRRKDAETARAAEERKRGEAATARAIEADRLRQAEAARQHAEVEAREARAVRDHAQAEVARLAEDRARAQRALAANRGAHRRTITIEQELAAREAELARARKEQERTAERTKGLEAELAGRIAAARSETDKLARARSAEEQRLRDVEASRLADERRQKLAVQARGIEEERRGQAEAARQRAESEAAAALSARDEARAELARLASERSRAEQAFATARNEGQQVVAARHAALDKVRAEQQRADERARLQEAELQARLEAVRAETEKLARAREAERKQLESLRAERDRLAAETARLAAASARAPSVTPPPHPSTSAASPAPVAARTAPAPTVARAASPAPAARNAPAARIVAPEIVAIVPGNAPARVTSVDFRDEIRFARVVIGLAGDAEFTLQGVPAARGAGKAPRTAVLRIRSAVLPPQLARTLDTSAFDGPVAAVSASADPDDPSAVRVLVRLGADVEPEARRERGRIVWDFPKATLTGSFEPPRMAGYGLNTLPLQVGDPTIGLPLGQNGAGPGRPIGPPRKRFNGTPVNLDLKDVDIHNLLRLLSEVGNVNIITSDDVKGTVTIRMKDTPWDQALDVILRQKQLGSIREGNIIRVAPQAVLERERETEVAQTKIIKELLPLETRLVPLSYAAAEKILPRVQDLLSPRGKVSFDERTNTLIITDIAGNLSLARDLIANLDTQTPQVLIEARIVEAQTNFLRDIGIQWGGSGIASSTTGNPTGLVFPSTLGVAGGNVDNLTRTEGLLNGQAQSPNYVVNLPAAVGTGAGGALGLTFGSVNGNVNVNLRLSAAESTGNVRILSAPKITTLDNIQATIEQGTAIPISVVSAAGVNTVFVDAKLNLTVKPHVTHEGSIVMYLEITRNEPDFSHTGARGDPTILKRQAKTEMLVRDGDTAVIGGIYSRNTATNYNKIPWLAEIPILGWLFKQRRETDTRSELLIFITPRIVNRAASISNR